MSFNFMAAITICSDFGAWKIKSATVSTVSPSICHEVMGPDAETEDTLEKEMATYSSILSWEIPGTEESGELRSMGLQRIRHN